MEIIEEMLLGKKVTSVSSASSKSSFWLNWCLRGGRLFIFILKAFRLATSESTVFSFVDCRIALAALKVTDSVVRPLLIRVLLLTDDDADTFFSVAASRDRLLLPLSVICAFFFITTGSLYLLPPPALLFWAQSNWQCNHSVKKRNGLSW